MKTKIAILILLVFLILFFANCNIFDDDYVWDDWVVAFMNNVQ